MQNNRGRGNQKGRLREIICPQCKLPYLRSVGRINFADKIGRVMFCSVACYVGFRSTGETPEARARRIAAVSKRRAEKYWRLKSGRQPFVPPFTEETYIKFISSVEKKYGLTGQQAEAISHVMRGKKHDLAAEEMGIATGTFRSHVDEAYMKMHVWTVSQCVITLTPILIRIHEEGNPGHPSRIVSAMGQDSGLLPAGIRA